MEPEKDQDKIVSQSRTSYSAQKPGNRSVRSNEVIEERCETTVIILQRARCFIGDSILVKKVCNGPITFLMHYYSVTHEMNESTTSYAG